MPEPPLGELLASTVPDPPVNIDVSQILVRARRRARLRLTALAIAAAAAVLTISVSAGSFRSSSAHLDPLATKGPNPKPSALTPGPALDVVGLAVDAAMSALTQTECMGHVDAIVHDSAARVGQVLAQRTTSDICEVALTVSAGPASAAPPCASLAVTAGIGGAGLGHGGFPLHFLNNGPVACALSGYPNVMATDSLSGNAITARHTPDGYLGGTSLAVPTLVLRPGDEVSALVEGVNNPLGDATSCSELTHLRVTVNGHTTSVGQTLSNCDGMEVHLYVPGTTGTAA